jgi:hypothetical protein
MGWRRSGVKTYADGTRVPWRTPDSLNSLLDEIEDAQPERDTTPDGTVASSQHTINNSSSDHEPVVDPYGIVCAADIAHSDDPDGTDVQALFDSLLESRDERIKYLIHNSQIASSYSTSTRKAWEWGPYTGYNAHVSHGHISVRKEPEYYDDPSDWVTGLEEEVAQFTDEDAHILRDFARGIRTFNDENPDDKTSGYGVGRLGSKTIRHHEREEGTGWDHPPVPGMTTAEALDQALADHAANPDAHHE